MAKVGNTKNLKPWQPGQSGNPDGRPQGSRNRSTIVKQWLEEKATDGQGGQVVDQLVRALIGKAAKGDVAAFRELTDSGYGKTKDEDDNNITYVKMGHIKLGDKKLEFNIGKPAPEY